MLASRQISFFPISSLDTVFSRGYRILIVDKRSPPFRSHSRCIRRLCYYSVLFGSESLGV